MKVKKRQAALVALGLATMGATLLGMRQFNNDMQRALAHAAQGSVLLPTRCGPIEYQASGTGVPLLAVHGSGGGHDQGMALAAGLASQGIRVVAMWRFGYLRDALGIPAAAIMGGSADVRQARTGPVRLPDRVSAPVLLVPLAYKPRTRAHSASPMSPWIVHTMTRFLGLDFFGMTQRVGVSSQARTAADVRRCPERVAAAAHLLHAKRRNHTP